MPRKLLLPVLLLIALPSLARAATPDLSEWQALLSRYVIPVDPAAGDGDTRFDYEQFYVDDHIWKLKHSPTLDGIHNIITSAEPSRMARDERIAWAVNTYNFLVIERATAHLLIPGKGFVRFNSVEEMRDNDGTFFAAKVAVIEGRPYSLPEFERTFVYGDTTPAWTPRKVACDPRLALALCSGHVGDPPIAQRLYRADSLDLQLEAAARRTFGLARFTAFDESRRALDVSAYLMDRTVDYGGSAEGIVPWILKYGPDDVRKLVRRYKVARPRLALKPDKLLNQFPRAHVLPKHRAPAPADSAATGGRRML